MKWTRSRGSTPTRSSFPYSPLFFSLPSRQIRVIPKERTFCDWAFDWQSKWGFETSENETGVRFSLRTSFSQVLSSTNAWRAIQTDPEHDLQSALLPLSWFIQVTDESLRFLWFTMIGAILLHKSWFGSFQWNTPKDYKIEFFFHVFQLTVFKL